MPITIQTSPGTGGLWFNTSPDGAIIIIDGQEYPEKTPSAVNNMPPGEHTFSLKLLGYNDIADTASVIEGRMCCVEYNMASQESTKACNPTPIPETGPPSPSVQIIPQRDYGMLVIGVLIGITIILLIDKYAKPKV